MAPRPATTGQKPCPQSPPRPGTPTIPPPEPHSRSGAPPASRPPVRPGPAPGRDRPPAWGLPPDRQPLARPLAPRRPRRAGRSGPLGPPLAALGGGLAAGGTRPAAGAEAHGSTPTCGPCRGSPRWSGGSPASATTPGTYGGCCAGMTGARSGPPAAPPSATTPRSPAGGPRSGPASKGGGQARRMDLLPRRVRLFADPADPPV